MEILIIGMEINAAEGRLKFGADHTILHATDLGLATEQLKSCDVIFDFTMHENPSRMALYKGVSNSPIFFEATTTRIANLLKGDRLTRACFGFCGLPTFLNRDIMEVTLHNEQDRPVLEEICGRLKTKCLVVADQIGMVTPRVICMIINEAFYTLEEGTATREDIDLAMKLGTNYPFGPFEWGERIGLGNVVQLLTAVHQESGDSRYQVCPLLRKNVEAI